MTATLNINTIRDRAAQFAKEFAGTTYESGFDQKFVNRLCWVFNISDHRLVDFQTRVKKLGGRAGRIDAFLPGKLLVEMKSGNKDLGKAYVQATEYFPGLKDEEMPRYVLVSDFANLHLYNLETKAPRLEIKLADFPQHVESFLFLADYEAAAVEAEQAANERAADKMAGLHDAIKATGYEGKDLETYLVRLLFCLFAEDTGLFGENGRFLDLLVNHTKVDGSDLHGTLSALFDTLNREPEKRPKNLPEHLAAFPYVNGALFKDSLSQCYFDEAARNTLIECARLDWSQISPAIFGSLFQAIMHFDDEAATAKTKKRREFGAHYTSEANILKVIRPLFLDDLRAEFEKIRRQPAKLRAFHEKLKSLNFFDPACGCGNFLVIAYRELRLLEMEVIEALWGKNLTGQLDVDTIIQCNVDQFHGIEIDPSAAQIATVALWLTDHQMNLKVQRFGNYYNRIPLTKKANIVCGNALRIDWAEVLPPEKCSFIMGNPPFLGKKEQSLAQKADLEPLLKSIKGSGVLDYVTGWYVKVASYIQKNKSIPVAFVSTNSICQGEQAGVLWPYMLSQGIKIHFAHRTFRWSNEGKGVAAVHCVIVGFGMSKLNRCVIYDYGDNISGLPTAIPAKNINPYLVDAPDIWVEKRTKPICKVAEINKGSEATDFGYLVLSPEQKLELLAKRPQSERWIKRFVGGDELINNLERYCLWLVGIAPAELKVMPEVIKRVELVREARQNSGKARTREWAQFPTLFSENRQPDTNYLAIPKVSSERRQYLPICFVEKDCIASGSLLVIPNATHYEFAILNSSMHNAWMRTVCGRMKSDYQYSAGIVYNNFPWPEQAIDTQREAVESAAQSVLDARKAHQSSTLADLYDPITMPPNLSKAHIQLDKAVDAAYGYKGSKDDAARVAFLFTLYQALVSGGDQSAIPETDSTASITSMKANKKPIGRR